MACWMEHEERIKELGKTYMAARRLAVEAGKLPPADCKLRGGCGCKRCVARFDWMMAAVNFADAGTLKVEPSVKPEEIERNLTR